MSPKKSEGYITITPDNIVDEHICCGFSDKKIADGYRAKKELMGLRYHQGYRLHKLAVRGKVFVEYVPAEFAWAPVIAPHYTFIHCFWVSGQYKGQGHAKALLKHMIDESGGKAGLVAVVAKTKKPFLSDKSFYASQEFVVCDTAPPYFELMVKQFNSGANLPTFADSVRSGAYNSTSNLAMFYSDQCPFASYWTDEMIRVAAKYKLSAEKIKIKTLRQAQNAPTPFTIFTAFLNGKFLTHELMAEGKFRKLLEDSL